MHGEIAQAAVLSGIVISYSAVVAAASWAIVKFSQAGAKT